jgi:hypothetical protein
MSKFSLTRLTRIEWSASTSALPTLVRLPKVSGLPWSADLLRNYSTHASAFIQPSQRTASDSNLLKKIIPMQRKEAAEVEHWRLMFWSNSILLRTVSLTIG